MHFFAFWLCVCVFKAFFLNTFVSGQRKIWDIESQNLGIFFFFFLPEVTCLRNQNLGGNHRSGQAKGQVQDKVS